MDAAMPPLKPAQVERTPSVLPKFVKFEWSNTYKQLEEDGTAGIRIAYSLRGLTPVHFKGMPAGFVEFIAYSPEGVSFTAKITNENAIKALFNSTGDDRYTTTRYWRDTETAVGLATHVDLDIERKKA